MSSVFHRDYSYRARHRRLTPAGRFWLVYLITAIVVIGIVAKALL